MAMAQKQLFTLERNLLAKRGFKAVPETKANGITLEDVMEEIKGLREAVEAAQAAAPIMDNQELLNAQLQEMRQAIFMTKQEIAAIRHPKAEEPDRLEAASMELSAIVEATEEATDGILNAAEQINEHCETLTNRDLDPVAKEVIEQILSQTIEIFEKCNFQDITGQRIGKVTRTLGYLEGRIETMIEIWGQEGFDEVDGDHVADDEREEAHLLEGPQHKDQGVDQDAIDAMFD